MLELNQINAGYGEIQILWDVSLAVAKGEIVALVGANGAGKSTIIKAISGLNPPRSGSVVFESKHLEKVPVHRIITHGIALVPEGRRLFPYMSVRENLEMGDYIEKDRNRIKENLHWIYELFPRLQERRNQLAGTMSGGEQQMLTIGRSLMSRPKLLMMDEPSLGLAPVIVEEVFKAIKILQTQGLTILLVEQNVRKALQISQRGYVLEHGRIVKSGDNATLMADEDIKKAYLGI